MLILTTIIINNNNNNPSNNSNSNSNNSIAVDLLPTEATNRRWTKATRTTRGFTSRKTAAAKIAGGISVTVITNAAAAAVARD